MGRLDPGKLHVRLMPGVMAEGPLIPRCYTLTHSDVTGDLFLTVGTDYDQRQISGWYARLLRDEVLAEWRRADGTVALHVHCHVSGGIALGASGMRDAIFRRELPLVLEALRYGDTCLYEAHPSLDQACILVHFHAREVRYDRVEPWGRPGDYAVLDGERNGA
jgi:hypothetical protein